ncbi:MAG: hypothetical protein E6Q33_10815 [Neisseriales bacterium]|nr:MAG: hypothetical protein E6Q33_10815 [Neisseriales bacterium]
MQKISLKFGWRTIIFFLLLELFTVPPVAMSNSIVIQNIWYMAIMGFIVALVCVYFLLRILKAFLIRNSERIIGVRISDIYGIWYIALLAGILLMIMFVVQDFLFAHNFNDFSAGFFSAFFSVGGTLLIYKLGFYCGLNISLNGLNTSKYQLDIGWGAVLKLSLLFGIYELIVCPITGLWIPYPEHRFSLAVISGIVGGATGGALVAFISSFVKPMQAELIFKIK